MHNKHEYDIPFVALKPGEHVYEYSIDDRFFEAYGEQDFEKSQFQIKLTLDKQTNLMQLKFEVGGQANVVCDRCGNDLTLDIWEEFKLFIKLDDNPDAMNETEEDPDIFYIGRGDSIVKIADWLFEFASLSLPYQRICKENESGESQCNKAALDFLKKSEELVKQAEAPTSNIWDSLPKTDNNN
jgi:uncharacterized metal-binding protein YceD (DUF177 family)